MQVMSKFKWDLKVQWPNKQSIVSLGLVASPATNSEPEFCCDFRLNNAMAGQRSVKKAVRLQYWKFAGLCWNQYTILARH